MGLCPLPDWEPFLPDTGCVSIVHLLETACLSLGCHNKNLRLSDLNGKIYFTVLEALGLQMAAFSVQPPVAEGGESKRAF